MVDNKEVSFEIVKKNIFLASAHENIRLEDRLMSDLSFDSIELIDLIMNLEQYNVFLSKDSLKNDITVGELVDMVCEKYTFSRECIL